MGASMACGLTRVPLGRQTLYSLSWHLWTHVRLLVRKPAGITSVSASEMQVLCEGEADITKRY